MSPVQSGGSRTRPVEGERVRVMRVKIVENVVVVVLLQKVPQSRKCFVFKVKLGISREKNTIEVSNDDR